MWYTETCVEIQYGHVVNNDLKSLGKDYNVNHDATCCTAEEQTAENRQIHCHDKGYYRS